MKQVSYRWTKNIWFHLTKMSSLGRPSARDFCTSCLIFKSPCTKYMSVWIPMLEFFCAVLVTTLLDVLKQMGVTLGILESRFTGVLDSLQWNKQWRCCYRNSPLSVMSEGSLLCLQECITGFLPWASCIQSCYFKILIRILPSASKCAFHPLGYSIN